MTTSKRARFPLGHEISLEELDGAGELVRVLVAVQRDNPKLALTPLSFAAPAGVEADTRTDPRPFGRDQQCRCCSQQDERDDAHVSTE